jgi:hypothetical protein
MPRIKDAHEITERPDRYAIRQAEIRAIIEEAIKPLNDWEEIQDPERYIETRLGRYIHLLEGLLDRAAALGDMDRVHAIALDLIRLSKLGRSKAEINVGVTKLREEKDFSKLGTDEIAKLLGEVEGGNK